MYEPKGNMITKANIAVALMFSYFTLLACAGCSRSEISNFTIKTIRTQELKELLLNDSLDIDVEILRVYANERPCNSNHINANLYLCRNVNNGDTLYVFETCDKPPSFAKEGSNEIFGLTKENIKKDRPDSVNILIPKNYEIPPRAKTVFASLTRFED